MSRTRLLTFAFLSTGIGDALATLALPPCDHEVAINLLKEAIDTSPDGKTRGLKALAVKEPSALGDSRDDYRSCTAEILTNGGKLRVTYTIEWMAAGKIYLGVKWNRDY